MLLLAYIIPTRVVTPRIVVAIIIIVPIIIIIVVVVISIVGRIPASSIRIVGVCVVWRSVVTIR
jgi:hypothetical protein